MKEPRKLGNYSVSIKSYVLVLTLFWSAVAIGSMAWNVHQIRQGTLGIARSQARIAYEKDVIYRRWNSMYGGVFVPETEKSPPNPYLDVQDREVMTSSGVKLIRMNPAYMTRQVHELAEEANGIQGHITSLNPIRPANAPDPWEAKSLEAFQRGEKEVSSIEEMGAQSYLRLMRPLVTEEDCLKCHAAQGYKIGDIRGGISISLPMASFWAIERPQKLTLLVGHGLLWLVGMVGLTLGTRRFRQQVGDQERAEAALYESEEKFRKIVESSPMGIHLYSMVPDGRMIFIGANPAADAILGIENNQLIGKTLEEAFPTLVNTEIPEQYRHVCTTGVPWQTEKINYQDDQIKGAFEVHAFRTIPNMMAALFLDITERKRTEEALCKSKEMLSSIFRAVPTGIGVVSNRVIKMANERLCEITGYSDDELHGQNARMLYPTNEEFEYVGREKYQQIANRGTGTVETHWKRKNGEVIDVLLSSTPLVPDDLSAGVVFSALDITERKRIENKLQFTQFAIDHSDDAAFWMKKDARFFYVNDAACRALGYSRDELLSMTVHDIDPDFPEEAWAAHWKEIRNRGSFVIESHQRTKQGMVFPVEIKVNYLKFGEDEFNCALVRDISHRKKAEAVLRESEERFRTLVEESPLAVSLIGKDGRYKYINPQFRNMFGYSIDDVPTGSEWFKKAYPDKTYRAVAVKTWISDQKQTGVGQARPRVYTVTCKDGSLKEIHFRPVTMENLDQFVIYEDITEKTKMERQLQQAQKFEAIGTLAGGIAHDFNNLLMGIQGRSSLLQVDLGSSHPHLEHINAIEEYVRSATDLTKQLLGLAQGGKYEVKPININELVLSSSSMFGRTRKEIKIHNQNSRAALDSGKPTEDRSSRFY